MPDRGPFDAASWNEFRWHSYPKGKGMRRLDQSDVAWWSDAGALVGIELPNLSAVGTGHQGVTLGTPAFFDADAANERCAILLDGTNDSISIGASPYTEGYFDFRADEGHLITAPSHASYNLGGDLTLMACLEMGDWTPGGIETIWSRWLPETNRVMLFRINGAGRLLWNWSTDGANNFQVQSSEAVAPPSSGRLWVAVAHDVNNGSGGNTVRFFTSESFSEPTTMTMLGTAVTNPAATTSYYASSSAPVRLGSRDGNQERIYARVKTAVLRGSISGANIGTTSEVFRIDADAIIDEGASSIALTSPTGQVATVTGSILKRPVGGGATFGPGESGTVMVCGLIEPTQPSTARLIESQGSRGGLPGPGGWAVYATATSGAALTARVTTAGTNATHVTAAETAITNNPDVVCVRHDRNASLLRMWTNSGGETTAALPATEGSVSRYSDVRIGSGENAYYANFDFYSGAIFRTAITNADRDLVKQMFLDASDYYDDGDFWTVTTPGIFEGVFYMPGDQVLATGGLDMEFDEVTWARIPAPTEGAATVPEQPGYAWFPGTLGNYMTTTLAITADAAVDFRVEVQRPAPAATERRPMGGPFYVQFGSTGLVTSITASDGTFPNSNTVVYATLEAAGFPAVGQWVQIRGSWNPTTDTLTTYWRMPNLPLDNDTGWITSSALATAGKQVRTTDTTLSMGANSATLNHVGNARRWHVKLNGSTHRDVNLATNIVDASAASFTATTGQTVTVLRAGAQQLTLYKTVPAHTVNDPGAPPPATYFGLVEMNGPPSPTEAEFFNDPVIYPYRRLDIHHPDGSLWVENAPLIAGSVNIEYDRDERRSGDCEIWLPETAIGPGGLWYDKVFKFYRGITFGEHHHDPNYRGATLVWQIGSFMADRISEGSESANFKVTFRDLTKRMMLSKLTEAVTFPEGEEIAVVIKALAANAGVLDMLVPPTGKQIGKDFTFETGSSRWEIAKKIANDFGFELFFDHRGWLVMRPFIDPLTSPIYLNLVARREGLGADGRKSNVGSYDRSTSDERIYNHVVVIGEGTDRTIVVRGEAENTLPNSPTSIARIGRRTMTYTSSFITTQEQANETAKALLAINALEQFEINVGTITYPWVEVGTTIKFDDDDPDDNFPSRYLLLSATIPLGLEAMSLSGSRVTIVGSAT